MAVLFITLKCSCTALSITFGFCVLFVMQEHNTEQENTSHHAERAEVVRVRTWNETFIFCMLQWSHRNLKQKEEKNRL
jgi:hypothetical protein